MIRTISVSPSGEIYVYESWNSIGIFDSNLKRLGGMVLPSNARFGAKMAINGKYLVTGTSNYPPLNDEIVLVDRNSGKVAKVLPKNHNSSVLVVAISPDGKILASGSKDYTVELWDISGLP